MDQPYNACSAWLCRSQLDTRSQTDQAWPQLNWRNQMKHGTQRIEQQSSYHRHQTDSAALRETPSRDSLNMSWYPGLGEKKVRFKIAQNVEPYQETDNTTSSVKTKVKHKKPLGPNRYKRTEKISIDLKKALESAGYFTSKSEKKSVKLKINIYKVNTKPNNKNSLKHKGVEIKKVKLYNIRSKKLSRLKLMILLERSSKSQRRNREYRDGRKREEKSVDANSINLNTLKIKPDPEIDIDYVKRMSTLTVYDTDYRNPRMENISEDTVQFRSDIMQKFDELKISNLRDRCISTTPYRNAVDNTDDLVVLQRTLSLKDEDDVDSKSNVTALQNTTGRVRYSKNFREYCNNLLTHTLNESLEKFLSEIKRLQTKLYDRNQCKGKYKRRYYSGLKEVQKHVVLKKVRFVVIAPDIEKIQSEGGLDDEIEKLLELCKKHETVFCFGLRRRKLGYYAHGNGLVGCIGIANYGNAEQLFWNVLVEVSNARKKFEELRGSSEKAIDASKIIQESGLLTENIETLLKSLASVS